MSKRRSDPPAGTRYLVTVNGFPHAVYASNATAGFIAETLVDGRIRAAEYAPSGRCTAWVAEGPGGTAKVAEIAYHPSKASR